MQWSKWEYFKVFEAPYKMILGVFIRYLLKIENLVC
jgi:hypothetical protein